jgi:hypothetical protein
MPHPACLDPETLAAECDFRATRRSGPGGQNRNKVETAVILTHRPTGIAAEAAERRSQGENRKVAMFRLRLKLALALRFPPRDDPGFRPSSLWQRRCRNGRIAVNPEHDDFPSILAEALDVLDAVDHDARRAAEVLGCSASQLVNLLKDEPRALRLLNDARRSRGLHALQ